HGPSRMLEHVDDFQPETFLEVFLADRVQVGERLQRIGRAAGDVQAQQDDRGYAGAGPWFMPPRFHFVAPLPVFAAPLPPGEGLSAASALRRLRSSSFCLLKDASRT